MGIKSKLLITATLILPTSVNAAIITQGFLMTDTTGAVITDTNTGREYLRFDEFDYSYAETVAAISSGGIYEGWAIADSVVADSFIEAIFGVPTTPCSGALADQSCGNLIGWTDDGFGATYSEFWDYFAYTNYQTGVGLVEIDATFGLVTQYETSPLSIAQIDTYAAPASVNWLLYKEITPVPVPSAVWLFGSGLLGLIGVARRKVRG